MKIRLYFISNTEKTVYGVIPAKVFEDLDVNGWMVTWNKRLFLCIGYSDIDKVYSFEEVTQPYMITEEMTPKD